MTDPLILRFRDADDLREQEHRHLSNALARAIHHSQTYSPPRAPQSVPHATPCTPATGSELAQRCEELAERYWYWHQQAVRADADGAWDDYIRAVSNAQAAREQHEARARKLAGYAAPLPRLSHGLSGVYEVRPGPYVAQRPDGTRMTISPARLIVDTTQAAPDLQTWLRAYRHGGSEALPWEYKANQGRYYKAGRVPDAVREHLLAIQLSASLLP